ncbi:MAG: DUF3109 family protein [Bacteroidales bacterium]|nr:DUF3109 family protein [Bacteroidales bacterium]
MIQIDHTIVSLDVIEQPFACHLMHCKGACCVEGDSGAPLEDHEIIKIEENINIIQKYLPHKSLQTIQQFGFYFIDNDGDKVTQLNQNKECVFTCFENNIAYCSIEKAFLDNKISFRKPISCFLYPIRLTKYSSFIAINYHAWNICKPAIENGKKNNIKVYEACKDALIEYFGQEWYDKLLQAAEFVNNKKAK